jgi:hypothetical protein
LTGTHSENERRVDKNYLEEISFNGTTRTECVLERGETNGKKQSLLAKICYGPMFHLGVTGNE